MTRWNFSTTGNEVVETFKDRVKGKTIVITGPSLGGIGAETALSLASGSPFLLILAGRSESNILPVISAINSQYPSVVTRLVNLDLSSQKSVRDAAREIKDLAGNIDILINNAAIMACPYKKSEDGVEIQFATNYLGHFLLTNLLMEKILKSGLGARVVNVSSSAHIMGEVRFEDVNFQDGKVYNEWLAYGQSKSAAILFAHALATKLEKYGGFSFSLNPGSIRTGLQLHMLASDTLMQEGLARIAAIEKAAGRIYKREALKTLQEGCATTLVAALDPELEDKSGAYLNNADIASIPPPNASTTSMNQELLWRLSEDLVGRKFKW